MPEPDSRPQLSEPAAPAGSSVWLTGQVCSREQRRGRYTRASVAHPGKMLPAIARHAITTWTEPGDIVVDPMAGIGTTIVEAMHLGRHGAGMEYEPRWAHLAADNIALATQQGADGSGQVWCGDSRRLNSLIPSDIRGRVALVITSPPYGSSTHGKVRTGPKGSRIDKVDHRYSADPDNLAHADFDQLIDGFAAILAESATLLRPGGTIAVTARPMRHGRDLFDIPGMAIASATRAGLRLDDRCVALIAAIREGRLITRASFFQQHNIRHAHEAGDPQWLVAHEDLLVFRANTDRSTNHGRG